MLVYVKSFWFNLRTIISPFTMTRMPTVLPLSLILCSPILSFSGSWGQWNQSPYRSERRGLQWLVSMPRLLRAASQHLGFLPIHAEFAWDRIFIFSKMDCLLYRVKTLCRRFPTCSVSKHLQFIFIALGNMVSFSSHLLVSSVYTLSLC